MFGILLFVFNILVERISLNRAPIAGPDYSIRLELLLQLIYAGLRNCDFIFIYAISNSNLVFHFIHFVFSLIFRLLNESKIVNKVFSQASSSLIPVWIMLLLGNILCVFIIWLFYSSLNGGLRSTLLFIISPDELKYPFLMNIYYLPEILCFLTILHFVFLLLYKKFVNNNRKHTKIK